MKENYVFVDYTKLREEFPEFEEAIKACYDKARKRGEEIWAGYKAARSMFPKSGEFGEIPILPRFVGGKGGATLYNTFNQNYTATGWQTFFEGTVPEDIMHAIVGIMFASPTKNVTEMRVTIGDKLYPRLNLEEIRCLDTPAVIFAEGMILQQERTYAFRGNFEATGWQRIGLLVKTFFKKVDDVIVDGAA